MVIHGSWVNLRPQIWRQATLANGLHPRLDNVTFVYAFFAIELYLNATWNFGELVFSDIELVCANSLKGRTGVLLTTS